VKKKLEGIGITLATLFFLIIGNWIDSKPDYYLSTKVLKPGETQAVIQMANGEQSTLIYKYRGTVLLPNDILIVGVRLDEFILRPGSIVSKDLLVLQRKTWAPVASLPIEYNWEEAARDGCCVVIEHRGLVDGAEVFNGFTLAATQGISCHIRISNYDIHYHCTLYDVNYNGDEFTVTNCDGVQCTYLYFYEGKQWCSRHGCWEYTAILSNAETYSAGLLNGTGEKAFILYQDHQDHIIRYPNI
jgi:hypothetical protein